MKLGLLLRLGCVVFATGMAGCQSVPKEKVSLADDSPLYGELISKSQPKPPREDKQFIHDVTKQFGSRQAAAKVWIDYGFRNFGEKQYSVAMKRFNQAWMLDPQNPEVYWGFATICMQRKETVNALLLLDRAFILGLRKPGFLADAGAIYARAATDVDLPDYNKLSAAEKSRRLKRADELFELAANTAPNNAYVAEKRLTSLIAAERYADAWKEIERGRQAGVRFPPELIQYLRENTPKGK